MKDRWKEDKSDARWALSKAFRMPLTDRRFERLLAALKEQDRGSAGQQPHSRLDPA